MGVILYNDNWNICQNKTLIIVQKFIVSILTIKLTSIISFQNKLLRELLQNNIIIEIRSVNIVSEPIQSRYDSENIFKYR